MNARASALAVGLMLLSLFACLSNPAAASEPGDQLLRGWPQRISLECGMSVAVADLDGDGVDEIIGCSIDGCVGVWDHDGTLLPGWPYVAPGTGEANATPACADLDGDGDLEIILSLPTEGIQAWHHDGSTVAGWPKTFDWPQRPFASVSVGNLDQDPELEIVGSVNDPLALYVWNADGTVLAGWPRTYPADWWAMSTTALFDLDGDGIQEIVFVCWSEQPRETVAHLIDATGADLPGWPVFLPGGTYCSPTVGDLDQDEDLEIAVVAGAQMYVLNLAGDIEPGWPFVFYTRATPGSPPFGQVDADQALETVGVAGSDNFYALNHDGTLLPGWPVDVSDAQVLTSTLLPSPILADLDGDEDNDVLICGSSGSRLWAFDEHGDPLPGWPRVLPGYGPLGVNCCTPVVADPDRDGDVEVLCAAGNGLLYVWDLTAPFDDRIDAWCSIHYDLCNTRYLDLSGGQSVPDVNAGHAGRFPRLQLTAYPTPFSGHLQLHLKTAAVLPGEMRVEIFDPIGALIATPFRGNGIRIVRDLHWDGRDHQGKPLESGVYLVRVQCGSLRQSQRVVLVQ
jgi:hypothetical protein